MGAGAVAGNQKSQDPHTSQANNSSDNLRPGAGEAGLASGKVPMPKAKTSEKMSCELCSVNFTFFKRKKCCVACQRFFCSNCLPKPPSSIPRQCGKCRLLISGHFTRKDLQDWKVKDMRCFLKVKNISLAGCKEKRDLIELVISRFSTQPGIENNIGANGVDELEHENRLRQMTAHMRNVSFVREGGNGISSLQDNQAGQNGQEARIPPSPSSTAGQSSAQPLPPTASSSSTSESLSASSSAQASTFVSSTASGAFASTSSTSANVSAGEQSAHGSESETASGQGGQSGVGVGGAAQQEARSAGGDDERLTWREMLRNIDHPQLRDLLETMERLHETLAAAAQEEDQEEADPRGATRRTQLDDVVSVEAVDELTVRQLKELLVNNFVDYRGCCERSELVQKVKNLWRDHQENKAIAEEIQKEDEIATNPGASANVTTEPNTEEGICSPADGTSSSEAAEAVNAEDNNIIPTKPSNIEVTIENEMVAQTAEDPARGEGDTQEKGLSSDDAAAIPAVQAATETVTPGVEADPAAGSSPGRRGRNQNDSLCHICMDNLVDCILLECGHMVTCTQCGKRLADCPICRQYISRVVRVFRS